MYRHLHLMLLSRNHRRKPRPLRALSITVDSRKQQPLIQVA
jgi:hypothetical protein